MATYHVPGDSSTIQGAIGMTGPGDTVIVGPGTYAEMVTIDESITLVSSGGPAATIISPFASGSYVVSIEASNVTLNGFTITNPDSLANNMAVGVVNFFGERKTNLRITNCMIHDVAPPFHALLFGTYGMSIGPVDGLEIDHNTIYNINDIGSYSDIAGIYVWGNNSAGMAENISMNDNYIYELNGLAEFTCAIRLDGFTGDADISGNVMTPFFKQGIVTDEAMIGPVTIRNNTVDGAMVYGLLLQSPYAQTVTGNTVKNSLGTGIAVTGTSFPPEIHDNNIFSNATGLDNESVSMVDARNNWWGAAGGPNTPGADTAVGPINYTPWLLGPYPPPVRGTAFII